MENKKSIAPCLFGAERLAADEFRRLGCERGGVESGRGW